MNKKYKFITFEGIEASGKSTQAKKLLEFFAKQKIPAVLTREPGGTKVAEEIRDLLINGEIDKFDGITEVLLNFAARRNHVENLIKPALNEGKIVICDRFYDSTFAYQGFAQGVEVEIINNIRKAAIADFAPNITFLINIDVKLASWRIKQREHNNRYEKMNDDFHNRVRSGFLKIAKDNPNRLVVIEGNKSADNIHKEILEILAG